MSEIPATGRGADDLGEFFQAAREFARDFNASSHNQLRGVTDGKAVGTYIEHKFRDFLAGRGIIRIEDFGSSAKGIDFPSLDTDVKVTSIRQPQSSSPFKSFKQKIEGLGYNLVLFVYEKTDTDAECFLPLRAVRFIPKDRTADYQTTKGIRDIIARGGDEEDLFAFLVERMIPVDEHTLAHYAKTLLENTPLQGYLTISNALQWRLQYKKVITKDLDGVVNLNPLGVGALSEELMVNQAAVDPLIENE
ncbi:MAG: restriction endonuclease [Acidobacteria bacterium]|nr:restriction endonuclease [Acidobacteriota bacterium]